MDERVVLISARRLGDLLEVVDAVLPQLDGVEASALRGAAAEVRCEAVLDAIVETA